MRIDETDGQRPGEEPVAQPEVMSSDGQPPVGDCPDAEQLTDVATNSCSPEQRKAALAHLAVCRTCYEAWVGICFTLMAMESGLERGKRPPLISLRNLVYLGSAIAIAICVVFFLDFS